MSLVSSDSSVSLLSLRTEYCSCLNEESSTFLPYFEGLHSWLVPSKLYGNQLPESFVYRFFVYFGSKPDKNNLFQHLTADSINTCQYLILMVSFIYYNFDYFDVDIMEDTYDNFLHTGNRLSEVEFTDMIFLDYSTNPDSKNGFIKVNMAVNLHTEEIRYTGIEYSDEKIKTYVEKNPSVLAKINYLRKEKK